MDHSVAQHDDHRSILRQARSPRHVAEQLSLVPHGPRGMPVGRIEQTESVRAVEARRVRIEVENMIKQYREAEQKHMGYSSLRESEVLKALVFLLRLAHGRTSGRPKSRAFVVEGLAK